MDTKLWKGDYKRDGRGRPVTVSGPEELLQRALIRLTVKRGSFSYDLALGSRLSTLEAGVPSLEKRALELAREALAPLAEVAVRAVSSRVDGATGRLLLDFTLTARGTEQKAEVLL